MRPASSTARPSPSTAASRRRATSRRRRCSRSGSSAGRAMARALVARCKDEWLARPVEAPLGPELPLVDAHHRCLASPDYRYYEEELLADIAASGHKVIATVHAETGGRGRGCSPDAPEALRPVGET